MKLSEIGKFKNGVNFSSSNNAQNTKLIGVSNFKDRIVASFDNLSMINGSKLNEDYFLKDGDILFVRSNGNKELVGRTLIVEDICEKITFSGFCIRYRVDKKIANPLYLIYLFKSKSFRKAFSKNQQTNINNLSQDILGKIEVSLPDLNEQNIIAKYLHYYTKTINMNELLIDKINDKGNLIFNYYLYNNKNIYSHNEVKLNELCSFTTGKKYASFGSKEGKYRFFSCSKDVLWCDEYEFDGDSIVVATHGDFYVKPYTNKFNAYICNSIIKVKEPKYFGLVYFSINKYINSLQQKAGGSIIKFIGNEEIGNIPVRLPINNEFPFDDLNSLIYLNEKIESLNIELANERDRILPMLMNGQIKIR